MFLEAKYYSTPCRLPVVRNAHGVIHDVSENFVHPAGSRPRRRYQYVYALFSASGFTGPAQDYGLGQQISLVDLSSASFGWLKEPIEEAASQLCLLRNQHLIRRFPMSWMRHVLRNALGTPSVAETPVEDTNGLLGRSFTNAPRFRAAAVDVLDALLRGCVSTTRRSCCSAFRQLPSFFRSRQTTRSGSSPSPSSSRCTVCGSAEADPARSQSGPSHRAPNQMRTGLHSLFRKGSRRGSARTRTGRSNASTKSRKTSWRRSPSTEGLVKGCVSTNSATRPVNFVSRFRDRLAAEPPIAAVTRQGALKGTAALSRR